jgi:biotin operon repressor
MRRKGNRLTLTTEHRAAPSQEHIPLQLTQTGSALSLTVLEKSPDSPSDPTPLDRVRQTLAQLQEPILLQDLRKRCGMRHAAVSAALEQLSQNGEVIRHTKGYQLKLPLPVFPGIDPPGNGNGKLSLCSTGG